MKVVCDPPLKVTWLLMIEPSVLSLMPLYPSSPTRHVERPL